MNSIHDVTHLEQARARCRIEPNDLRRLRNAFYKKQQPAPESLRHLPQAQRAAFSAEVRFQSLELHSRHDSQRDCASKLIYRTTRGSLLETVILRISSGRTSLCVSSQIGCAMGCAFC